MVLSAGRIEDSLPVVLRAGRWLHVQTPVRHQEDRPSVLPVGIYACCVTAKLRRGYGGMARRASGFVARVADGDNTAHQLREYLFVFRDIDMKRVEGSSALILRAHQLNPL